MKSTIDNLQAICFNKQAVMSEMYERYGATSMPTSEAQR